jgi:cysteinyl-tRNA synthetase
LSPAAEKPPEIKCLVNDVALVIHNTLSRRKEPFEPYKRKNVRMYVCGPTVYDLAHIGNARPVVAFDVLYRLLRLIYGENSVTYVRNITDVDDKIIAAAGANDEAIEDLTRRTEDAFHADVAALGTLEPDVEPRATEHIPEMLDLVATLIERGHAYEAEGHVLFDITSMAEYGRLSGHSRDELIAGARVEIAPYKKDPADFVLWKPSAPDQPGWDSPWGRGRPGWHLECSAMSEKHLGVPFDIHGGGQDLIFPHHENEIAQSRCAHGGETFAKYWMHNGYLVVEGEKMSKSLGNFFTVRELLADYPGEAIRLTLLQTHYRQPLDFTTKGLDQAKSTLDRLYTALRHAADAEAAEVPPPAEIVTALEDDLNTPQALAHLHELATALNKADNPAEKARLKGLIAAAGGLLGVLGADPEAWFQGADDGGGAGAAEIEKLITQRNAARAEKDFAEADRIRDELAAAGVVLEDGPDGTSWRRAG